ncbi:MAG: type II secretion system protein N [Proteobacteria bacterium]|nr:type II secretion system protein N [Pseudomonadota bacterium]MBU1686376.1 type II secretion system protein N [Pseudomonadota bacterium]
MHRTKKITGWLLLFATAYLFFFVAEIPAARAWSYLSGKGYIKMDGIKFSSIEGSWLNGRLSGVSYKGFDLGDLTWRLHTLPLLLGRINLNVEDKSPVGQLTGKVSMQRTSLIIRDLSGTVHANLMKNFAPLKGLDITGDFVAKGLGVALREGIPVTGEGQLVWREAGIGAPYELNLGGIQAELSSGRDELVIKLTDLGGNLAASGTCNVKPDGTYILNGSAGSRDGGSSKLSSFIQVLGEPGPDGRIRISHKGQLSPLL